VNTQRDIIIIDKHLKNTSRDIWDAFGRILEKLYQYSSESRNRHLREKHLERHPMTVIPISPFWYNPDRPLETSLESKEGWELHPAFKQLQGHIEESKTSNVKGREFMASVRAIIDECSRLESPARAARVVAHSMLVMLDGSGEACGTQYQVFTEDGEPVKFFHHDL